MKLILLPGMDGTGRLFADLLESLPTTFSAEIIRYPVDHCLSYAELTDILQDTVRSAGPFVLIAESFSTPLAIRFAATKPENLKGVILCAGFVSSPVRGLLRQVCFWAMPFIFRFGLPQFAAKYFLVGTDAPQSLLAAVMITISSVQPRVLSARLQEVLTCDVRTELIQVTAPILYLQAMQDFLVHADCLDDIKEIKPEVKVASIAGPHLLFQRQPQQTAAVVTSFVREISCLLEFKQ